MPTSSIERTLRELDALAGKLPDAAALDRLRRALGHRSNVVVARAAKLISRVPDHGLGPDLAAAFPRFLVDPLNTDKACLAKLAIVTALRADAHTDLEVFHAGLRHVQLEPAFRTAVDTAAPLRAACALALAEAGADGILDDLAVLLADPEPEARVGAARALSACGAFATPLLRFKVLTGDEQPIVIAECLDGLMSIDPEGCFDFVAALISPRHPDIAGHAAMAIAESHAPGAFALLRQKWEDGGLLDLRRELLLPLGLTRHEDVPALLLGVLHTGDLAMSGSAIAALAIFRDEPGIPERARNAIRGPYRNRLVTLLDQAFAG